MESCRRLAQGDEDGAQLGQIARVRRRHPHGGEHGVQRSRRATEPTLDDRQVQPGIGVVGSNGNGCTQKGRGALILPQSQVEQPPIVKDDRMAGQHGVGAPEPAVSLRAEPDLLQGNAEVDDCLSRGRQRDGPAGGTKRGIVPAVAYENGRRRSPKLAAFRRDNDRAKKRGEGR